MNLGIKIRSLRTSKGLKVKDLAESIGVNPVYLTQIEKHGKLPSLNLMKKICKELKCYNLFKLYKEEKYPEIPYINELIKRGSKAGDPKAI